MTNIFPKNLDANKLNQLGIYELRNIARSLGIPRPTTILRRELINAIITHDGDCYPEPERKNRGRPPRGATFDITQVLEAENDYQYSDDCVTNTIISASGFFHTSPNGQGMLIGTELCAYHVSNKHITLNMLAMGDFLEAKATYSTGRGAYVVSEISKINGFSPLSSINNLSPDKHLKTSVQHYDAIEGMRPNKPQQYGDLKFNLGQRVLIQTQRNYDRLEDIHKLSKESKCHKIALVVEETVDCVSFLTESGINEVFLLKAGDSTKKHIMLCLLALFTSKRHAEEGKDVILFVDNMTKLFKVYNKSICFDGHMQINQINLGPLADLKSFFMSARALEAGGSLSILAYVNESENEIDKFVFSEFADLANVTHPVLA